METFPVGPVRTGTNTIIPVIRASPADDPPGFTEWNSTLHFDLLQCNSSIKPYVKRADPPLCGRQVLARFADFA